jgi:hypothetical protein
MGSVYATFSNYETGVLNSEQGEDSAQELMAMTATGSGAHDKNEWGHETIILIQ